MRKDLQKRVLVVAAALERLAGPQEMAEVLSKISKLSGMIAQGNIQPDKLPKAHQMLQQLYRMHTQMATNAMGAGDQGAAATETVPAVGL